MASKTPGIRKTVSGWQVFVRVNGKFQQKHFPRDTPMAVLKAKRAELHAYGVLEMEAPTSDHTDTFAADCDTYLASVAGMITYSDRAYRIGLWRQVFGRRKRSTITSPEIRAVLSQWQKDGVAQGTLNLRLTALRHLWRVLDGRDAPNPARDISRFKDTPQPLSLPTWANAHKVIDRCRGVGKLRLRVLLETGWPSAVLKRVRPDIDLNYKRKEAQLFPRKKGGGTRTMVVPISDAAIAALKALEKANGFGDFSNSSVHSQVQRACRNVKVRPFRVYDLRHLFLTEVARASKDERGVSELALHSTPQQTRRYTEQAASTRARSALATFATKSGKRGGARGRKAAKKPALKRRPTA